MTQDSLQFPDHNRLLIVDDNPAIHEDFRKIFVRAPIIDELGTAEEAIFGASRSQCALKAFDLTFASNGQEALQKLKSELRSERRFALAFLDMRMAPGWDGLETALHLWETDPELLIVVCTAYSDYSLEEMTERLGRPDQWVILKKPFDPVEAIQLANSLTIKWHLHQMAQRHSEHLEESIRERTAELLNVNARLQAEIHQRIEAEESLRLNQKMLVRQERLAAVGEVTAGVAHEFNNILTVILGSASMASGETDQDTIDQALNFIVESSERAAGLVRQLLAFSRRQTMCCEPVELNKLVQKSSQRINAALAENIRIHFSLSDKLPLIGADADKLEQAFLNVVINAQDAMNQGGDLTICTRVVHLSEQDAAENEDARAGDFVCLEISDTGCGMAPSVLARIFEPFFTTKDIGCGTGLGLASVYGTIKQHEGWISVGSELNCGSSFKIYLPVCQAEIEDINGPAKSENSS